MIYISVRIKESFWVSVNKISKNIKDRWDNDQKLKTN